MRAFPAMVLLVGPGNILARPATDWVVTVVILLRPVIAWVLVTLTFAFPVIGRLAVT